MAAGIMRSDFGVILHQLMLVDYSRKSLSRNSKSHELQNHGLTPVTYEWTHFDVFFVKHEGRKGASSHKILRFFWWSSPRKRCNLAVLDA